MKINWKTLWITEVIAILFLFIGCQLILRWLDSANLLNKPATEVVTVILVWGVFWLLLMTIAIVKRSPIMITQLGGIFAIIGLYWHTISGINGYEMMFPLYQVTYIIQYLLLLVGIIMIIVGIFKERHGVKNYAISKLDFWGRAVLLAAYVWAFVQDVHLPRHLLYYADSGQMIEINSPFFVMNLIANLLILLMSIGGLIYVKRVKGDDRTLIGAWIALISISLLVVISYGSPTILFVLPLPSLLLCFNLMGIIMMLPSIKFSKNNN